MSPESADSVAGTSPVASRLSMARNVLGITWIHGAFKASSLAGDTVVAAWVAPQPVESGTDFAAALSQAVRETGFKGRHFAVVIDHRNLLFHLQETPPAKGAMLVRVIDRLVAQSQFFDEAALWRRVELPESKSGHRCLLALLPQSLQQAIEDAGTALGLQLTRLVPPAAIVARQLDKLDAAPDEVVILATDFGGALNIVLGRVSGQLLLSRTVVTAGRVQGDRAAQELNRTLHFAQQQFGATVNRIFISGEQSYESLKDVQIREGLKILNATPGDGTIDLTRSIAALPVRAGLNFARSASMGPVLVQWAAAACLAGALILSAWSVFHVESNVRAREQQAAAHAESHQAEAQLHATTTAREREARWLSAGTSAVGSTNDAPVAELFVRALPVLLAEPVKLSEARVKQTPAGWEFELKGTVRDAGADFSTTLESIEKGLQESVFQAKVTDSTQQQLFRGDAAEQVPSARRGPRAAERQFFVKGILP